MLTNVSEAASEVKVKQQLRPVVIAVVAAKLIAAALLIAAVNLAPTPSHSGLEIVALG